MASPRLGYFLVVAEELNLHRAAERLGIKQPSLSKQIRILEAEIGAELLVRDRHHRLVGLTPAGESFLEDARHIVEHIDRAKRSAQGIAAGNSGRLRLGVCEEATTSTLARIISVFRARVPEVEVELIEMPAAAQIAALRNRGLELGLILPPASPKGLAIETLWHEDWFVALPEAHPLAQRRAIEVVELADVGLVIAHPAIGAGYRQQMTELFRAAGIEPRIVGQALRRKTKMVLVAAGIGAAIVPSSAAMTIPGTAFRPLAGATSRMEVAAAYRDGGEELGLVRRFLNIAHEVIRDVSLGR